MVDPSTTTNHAAKNLHLPSFGCVLAKGGGRYRLGAMANPWWKLGIPRMDLLVDTHQKVKSLLGVRYFSISSEMEWWTHSNHSLPSGMFHERDPYGLPIATGFPLENTCVVSICFLLACELIDVDQLWSTSFFSSTQTSSPTNPYKAYHPATPKTLPGSAQRRVDGVDDPHDGIGLQGCTCACCACRWTPWCGAGTGPAMHTSGHSPAGTPNFLDISPVYWSVGIILPYLGLKLDMQSILSITQVLVGNCQQPGSFKTPCAQPCRERTQGIFITFLQSSTVASAPRVEARCEDGGHWGQQND